MPAAPASVADLATALLRRGRASTGRLNPSLPSIADDRISAGPCR